MSERAGAMERRVEFFPAKDWRKPDPKRDFGHIGMKIAFYVIGPKGVIQWMISPGWYAASSREALKAFPRSEYDERNAMKPLAWDLGYHAHQPQYDEQKPMAGECTLLGGPCYYDGTSLGAEALVEGFIAGGTDWLWPTLEEVYRSRFEGGAYPDLTPNYAPHPDDAPPKTEPAQ